MDSFENKTVCILSDSNSAHGVYFDFIRAYAIRTHKNFRLRNLGISGCRADSVIPTLEENFEDFSPDAAIVMFGSNDMGIWLYDCRKKADGEILSKRAARLGRYRDSLAEIARWLKNRGIVPIFASPICANSDIEERADIVTVADNKEKEDYIDDNFYKKATFRNINEGLKDYADCARETAKQFGTDFIDAYSKTMARVSSDCFSPDGMHYNDKGNGILADIFCEYFFGEKASGETPDLRVKTFGDEERAERVYYFLKYIIMGSGTKANADELAAKLKERIAKFGYVDGITPNRAETFYKWIKDPENLRKDLMKKFYELV